jgi:hypothetical protein
MSTVYDKKGIPIGRLRNSKLEWICNDHICTWTNPNLTAAVKKRKNRLEEGKSVSELYGGLK